MPSGPADCRSRFSALQNHERPASGSRRLQAGGAEADLLAQEMGALLRRLGQTAANHVGERRIGRFFAMRGSYLLQAAPPSTQNFAQCGWLSGTGPLASFSV